VYLRRVPTIRVLPDDLVNRIAAGEVVERPASVVKELVENSLDAGARSVRVELAGGGRELVAVEDDGSGMDRDDALLALERHATSKIGADADLARIATLGFRGEALPSIAAVALLTLESAPGPGEGTRVEVEFGRVTAVEPCVRPRGTRISVRDLFGRLPARRKFLRTEATELRHAVGTLAGLGFTRPDVAFLLAHGQRTVLDLPAAGGLSERLPDLVGARRARNARPVRHSSGSVGVEGFVIPSSGGRDVVLAVNGRVVRDRLLVAVVNRALRGPSGVSEGDAYLEIKVAVEQVDVNVHPTKAEVRFADPGAVAAALTQALALARAALHGTVEVRRVVSVGHPGTAAPPADRGSFRPGAGIERPVIREAETPAFAAGDLARTSGRWGRYVGQYRETYLVLEDADGLLLVDQHVAHERVLFERLLAGAGKPAVQRMLLPEVVELTPALAALAAESAAELEELGVELESASAATVRVLGLPASLPTTRAGVTVARLLGDLETGAAPGRSVRERAAASLSCQAAIKKNRPLSRLEAERLLEDLAATADPHRCPHGRPIMLRLPHDEIERRIGRR
jgi:DNA mismatch repair protein MutL